MNIVLDNEFKKRYEIKEGVVPEYYKNIMIPQSQRSSSVTSMTRGSRIKFDGDNFRFHSTLFQDSKISDKHDKMIEELSNEFKFPIELNIKEINLGISEVGTFKVYDKIELN